MDALAEMGKEEKKASVIFFIRFMSWHGIASVYIVHDDSSHGVQVRKGMEKLGMVPLDGLQQVDRAYGPLLS